MNKKVWKEVRVLFSGWELFFHLIFLFAINFGYFYIVSKNVSVSLVVGLMGGLFFFFVFTTKNKQLRTYQENLNELLKYVTNINFFLQTGENVYYALKATKKTVNPAIQKDIDQTIEGLENEAALKTKHFEKYHFPSLDQFHQNLDIKYNHGGEPKDLFGQIHKNMMFELKKRDELYRKRKGFAMNVYVLLGMVASMAILLRFITPELWDLFLSFPVASNLVLLITYGAILLNLYLLQKKTVDISVRL